ncbi:hypothetical protein [Helicobacter marmotae]|uniref:Uncharacterized protein n=1 Tax=Helicobacter marmotae TaxID=152490 RepID=A0A3D8I884_9HELI|nr:hypothetical protein [Helicobacter marmotae]RDU60741.1 hypothetical protein CQA63_01875 [Helicobacter marmotae]
MSGFIGLWEMFLKIELYFKLSLDTTQRGSITHALYPLSDKNRHNITKNEIKQCLQGVVILKDKALNEKLLIYIENYINENIKDML